MYYAVFGTFVIGTALILREINFEEIGKLLDRLQIFILLFSNTTEEFRSQQQAISQSKLAPLHFNSFIQMTQTLLFAILHFHICCQIICCTSNVPNIFFELYTSVRMPLIQLSEDSDRACVKSIYQGCHFFQFLQKSSYFPVCKTIGKFLQGNQYENCPFLRAITLKLYNTYLTICW